MPSFKNGSLRLFRFAGIDVFLHWAWFLVAAFEISNRTRNYSSPVWNVLEYLTLFLIVMVHEFGHARSLMAVVVIGFAGVAALIGVALWLRMPWFGILSLYILMNCWR